MGSQDRMSTTTHTPNLQDQSIRHGRRPSSTLLSCRSLLVQDLVGAWRGGGTLRKANAV